MRTFMILPSNQFLLIALLLFCSLSRAELGDNLVLYPTEIDAVIGFDGTKSRNGVSSRETEWEAGLRIGQMGYLLDPKIAWFLIDIEPVVRRNKFTSDASSQETDGDLLNYLVQTNFLRGTPGPIGVDFSLQKSDNLNTGSLGNRYDTVIESNKATIHWKNRAFPTSLTYEERTLDEEFRSSLDSSVTERDELLESLVLKGRSSKLNVHLEHATLDDRIESRNNDYELDKAYLSHNLQWGRNSYLQSNINHYERSGFNANKRFTLDETARIQHLDNLYSRSSYHYQSTTQTTENIEHGIDFELHHRLYNNLNSTLFVHLNDRDSDNVEEDKWRVGFGTQYNKNKLYGANTRAGLRASYQETDRVSMVGLVDVIDESHTVPLNGAVILDRRFIVTATIVVTDSTGSTTYDEGLDYTVLGVSGDFTQLQIIPGGRIDSGDTILVSYKAEQLPTQNFSTNYFSYNLSFDYEWMRVSHSDSKSNDNLISGASESFLKDTRNTLTEISFSFKPANIDTDLSAERRFSMNGDFELTQFTYSQLFSWSTLSNKRSRGILWNLNSIQSFTEQEGLDTDLYRINLSANWRPARNLTVRPTISYWKRIDEGESITSGRRDDRFFTAGIWARWRYRKIDLDFNYHHDERKVTRKDGLNETDLTEDVLMFTLKRRLM